VRRRGRRGLFLEEGPPPPPVSAWKVTAEVGDDGSTLTLSGFVHRPSPAADAEVVRYLGAIRDGLAAAGYPVTVELERREVERL